jgi:ABC-type branched-subunit amino acid transport system substrate-binding protein
MRRAIALLPVAALVTACGSTVATGRQLTVGPGNLGQTGTGGELGTTSGGTTPGGTTGGTVPGTTPGTGGGTTGAAGTTGQVGTTGTTGSVNGVLAGPGVTPTTINIGLAYAVNTQAAAAALGASGAGVGGGDDKAQWDIAIADINAHGGVLGRKLKPVYVKHDSNDQSSAVQQESRDCATWTQDNKVLAVIAPEADPSDTLLACVIRAGAAQIWEDVTRSDASTFARFPYYLEGGTVRMDRVAAAWAPALQRENYFTGWNTVTGQPGAFPVKVGIVSFNDPVTKNAVEHQLMPALKAAGHPVAAGDWVQVFYPTGEADNGRAISEIQAATLKFASDNVTHVLPFDAQGAGIGGFFAVGANSQRYYPRYGLNTGVGAQTLHDANLWPSAQLRGAVGFGWVPLLDLPIGDNPVNGPYSNAARRACVKLMTTHGEDVSSAIVQRQVTAKCDELQLFKQALEAGGAPNRDALVLGAQRLGSSFVSGMTFDTRYDGRHHDGAAAYRDFAFDQACGCFHYSGREQPLP